MHPRADTFRSMAIEQFDFEPAVHEFDEGTKTAADAASAIGCDIDQIASAIAIETDEGIAVVVTSGAHRVDLDKVAGLLEVSSASLGDPDDIKKHLGWSIGGVPPFCHDTDVPVLVDDHLFEYDEVWAAAGTPDAVFPIHPEELLEYSDGTRAIVHEHE